MDPEHPLESDLTAYLKSHPFVPISLVLSLGALIFGAISLTYLPSEPESKVSGVSEETETLLLIAVDVEGEVRLPGLIKMEVVDGADIRIADVIAAAGGLLPTADFEYVQRNLNLASLATDGMKLYVPKKGELSEGVTTSAYVSSKVNVNSASVSQLTTLKGIGDSRAEAIVKNRPYSSLEDLSSKTKISLSILEDLRDEIAY